MSRSLAPPCRALLRASRVQLASSAKCTIPLVPCAARAIPRPRCCHGRALTTTTAARRASAPATPPSPRGASKLYPSADHAVADIQSGSTLLSAGFGMCGTPESLINALSRRADLADLTAVSNNPGREGLGGLATLVQSGQLSRLTLSFIGPNKILERRYLSGQIAIELCPQGTLAERIRAAGAGIPAFFTPTGALTLLQSGEIPVRLARDGTVLEPGRRREARQFGGKTFLLETALPGDVAILRAAKVDEAGNCVFRSTTKAFGGIMAKAARLAIVEAEEIVPVGAIDPGEVDLPGIYVDRIVPATDEKQVEILKLADKPRGRNSEQDDGGIEDGRSRDTREKRERIARRAAQELRDGFYVNLGVGLPTLAPAFVPPDRNVWLQSENGLLGMGPHPATAADVDPDLVNAGKETVTIRAGGSVFDSAESFGMIRGGHVDVSILGALQVAANGDLANYMIPGRVMKGMGGAMDLVSNPDASKIVVATEHVDKHGRPKVVQVCDLPLTGARVVSTIITDLVDRENGGLTLTETAPGVSIDDIRSKTDAAFTVAADLKVMA